MGQGVPDDFIEEAKAVTDGHVVFLDDAVKALLTAHNSIQGIQI